MMPRIDAGERLAAISDAAIAAGNMRDQDQARIIRRLEEAQQGHRREAVKATPAVLAGMGIGVRSAAPEKGLNDG